MEHTYELKNGDLVVTVTNSKDDLAKVSHKALVSCSNEVTIRGFRKGKAPLDVASRAINPDALNDAFTKKLIDDSFKSYIKDEKIVELIRTKTLEGTVPSVSFVKPDDASVVAFTYPIRPEVIKLAPYTDLDSKVQLKKVDDAAINNELSRLALNEAELLPTSEESKLGDIVNLEVKGTINGIERPELNEKSIDLELGAHKFVPGFEEQIKGHKEGDVVTFPVTLPHNYPEGLADKEAVFTVKVLSVKTKKVPTIDDSFAGVQNEYDEVKNLAELKQKISEKLSKDYATQYRNAKYSAIIQKVIDTSTYAIDEKNLRNVVVTQQRKADEEKVQQQGIDLPTYLKLVGMDDATYQKNVWLNNLAQLKAQAVADAIAKDAKLPEPSEENIAKVAKDFFAVPDFNELKKSLKERYSETYKNAKEDEVNSFVNERIAPIIERARFDEVIEFVVAHNK